MALFIVPVVVACLVDLASDGSRALAALLLLEPVLVGACIYLCAMLLLGRLKRHGVALVLGVLVAFLVLHRPVASLEVAWPGAPWADAVQRCARELDSRPLPARILTWRADGTLPGTDPLPYLLSLHPDLVVLTGLEDQGLLDQIQDVASGESKFFGPPGAGMGVWVRGAFQYCGGRVDAWPLQEGEEGGLAWLTFPAIQEGPVLPFVAFQTSARPLSLKAASNWPQSQQQVALSVAAAGHLTEGHGVAAGHLGAPPTWRRTQGLLVGGGFRDLGGPPTWPSRAGPLPWLPFQRLDRVLGGQGWQVDETRSIRIPSTWAPLLVQVSRATVTARP